MFVGPVSVRASTTFCTPTAAPRASSARLLQHLDESGINLYYCAGDGRGFFVEVGIDDGRGQAVVLRSFVSSGPLQDYAQGVRLPGA